MAVPLLFIPMHTSANRLPAKAKSDRFPALTAGRKVGLAEGHLPLRCVGFSLLELVVSVTVIAVLLVVLVSGIKSAMLATDRVGCVTNLRRIGLALHMVNRDRGSLPGPAAGLQEFRGRKPVPGTLAAHFVPVLWDYLELPKWNQAMEKTEIKVMRCPGHRRALGPWPAKNYPESTPVAYDLNRNDPACRPFGHSGEGVRQPPMKLEQVEFPSRVYVLIDADSGPKGARAQGRAPSKPVHGKIRNVLYLDGHVEARPVNGGKPSLLINSN